MSPRIYFFARLHNFYLIKFLSQASGIFESIVVTFDNAFPLNSSSALKMSLNTTPCTRDGTECDPANTVFAQAQLYCGTSSDSVLDFVSGKKKRKSTGY